MCVCVTLPVDATPECREEQLGIPVTSQIPRYPGRGVFGDYCFAHAAWKVQPTAQWGTEWSAHIFSNARVLVCVSGRGLICGFVL